jgi:hypothetical protein
MTCRYCDDVHSAFDPCPEAFAAHRRESLIEYLCLNCPDKAKEILELLPPEKRMKR